MSRAQNETAKASSPESTEAHEIRITSHGKIASWVEFALNFFENNETRPLTFHTLPAKLQIAPAVSPGEAEDICRPEHSSKKQDRMPQSASLVPRLISVVEIVKREYLKKLDTSLAEKGALSGLFQYNELGNVGDTNEDSLMGDPEAERMQAVALALSGKNHPKLQRRNAFMKVTLCRTNVLHLAAKQGVTYQKPSVRNLSKSAKARSKRRLKKESISEPRE